MITFIHRLVFSSHLTLYIVMGCAHLMNGQEVKTAEFIAAVQQLQSGEIDSLSLSFGGSLPIKQFQFEGWEYFNRHELKDIERDPLSASKFRPLVKEDIVQINDSCIVLILTKKSGWKKRIGTFDYRGAPIQSFLIHDHYGYLYEKNYRSFSFTEPFRYNTTTNCFEFYQVIYGYEPIPSLENPTQDPIYLQSYHQLSITKAGEFQMVFSENAPDILFSRLAYTPKTHRVEYEDVSIIYVSNQNLPELELWTKTHTTFSDMESHDSIVITLSYGAIWHDQFFFVDTAVEYSIVNVSQYHENVMVFPGDGTMCTLEDWKRYRSSWEDLGCKNGFFNTKYYTASELSLFPNYDNDELYSAFSEACGEPINNRTENIGVATPDINNPKIVLHQVVVRITIEGPKGIEMKYLVFQIANSC